MMYFKKTVDAAGDFVAANGIRYSLAVVRRIRTVEGVNVGYVAFDSLAAALAAWELSLIEQEVTL